MARAKNSLGDASFTALARMIDRGNLDAAVELLDRLGSYPSSDPEFRKYQKKAEAILRSKKGNPGKWPTGFMYTAGGKQVVASGKNCLFSGVYPTGIMYADRCREVHGDYKRVAFLFFDTLEFRIDDPDSPLLALAKKDAARIIARRGEQYRTSGSGQTVTLGYALDKRAKNTGVRMDRTLAEVRIGLENNRAALRKALRILKHLERGGKYANMTVAAAGKQVQALQQVITNQESWLRQHEPQARRSNARKVSKEKPRSRPGSRPSFMRLANKLKRP